MENQKLVLFLDNCVLMQLAQNFMNENKNIINLLLQYQKEKKVRVIIPEQVNREWKNHLERCYKDNQNKYKKHLENFEKTLRFFDQSHQEVINPIYTEYKKNDSWRRQVESVNELVDYSDRAVLHEQYYRDIIELGVNKKAPFAQKNSMADAIIFFTMIGYLQENIVSSQVFFVSTNINDFCEKDNNNFHSDIKTKADSVGLKFSSNIGKLLKDYIDENAVSENSVMEIERSLAQTCQNCGYSFTGSEDGQWLRGPQGITYCYECPMCKSFFDTGDSLCD